VLILYPGDATPVCTQQLCAIRDEYAQFREANAVVFGINSGGANSHQQFAQKHQFSFPLLIDKGNIVTKRYGAKGLLAAKRTVYVVGLDGTIIFGQRGKPDNATILKAIAAK
jgi:peroxiredoxin Q/BCP